MIEFEILRNIVAAISLILLYVLEIFIPFFDQEENKVLHGAKNIGFALFNALMIAFLFTATTIVASASAFAQQNGLLNLLSTPLWATIIIAIVLFDFWMYLWHVAVHKIPFLWRFHRVHHTDKTMDVTTALRFHPGEILISSGLRIGIVMILGLQVWHLALYETILLPVIMLHHSNVKFPEKIDRWYRLLFASPHMHRIHHSDIRLETDTNYGSILSIWDRIFKTFLLRSDQKNIKQGVVNFKQKHWEGFISMLRLPFVDK